MSRNRYLFAMLLVFSLVLFSAACKKKSAEIAPAPDTTAAEPAPTPPPPTPPEEVDEGFETERPATEEIKPPSAAEIERMLRTVYFAFDQYDLTDETRRTLQANANVLQDNRGTSLIVEGHCDERGTIEYNLALGEKRARAVRDYMVSLGLSPSQLRIVTFGEERPADAGHTESAWSKNRRAEFKAER